MGIFSSEVQVAEETTASAKNPKRMRPSSPADGSSADKVVSLSLGLFFRCSCRNLLPGAIRFCLLLASLNICSSPLSTNYLYKGLTCLCKGLACLYTTSQVQVAVCKLVRLRCQSVLGLWQYFVCKLRHCLFCLGSCQLG